MKNKVKRNSLVTIVFFCLFFLSNKVFAIGEEDSIGNLISESISGADTFNVMFLLIILSLVPTMLIMMTSFTRIIIVLSFTRSALGTQQMPPNQVLIGIALFLSLMIMTPTINVIKVEAYEPYMQQEITIEEALERAEMPLKEFMFEQAKEDSNSLNLFLRLSGAEEAPDSLEEVPLTVLIPAFITNELKTAFKIGFLLFIPFIMIDMIVSSILMSMGMMMLPPAMISLPFKILLFVLIDGWELVMETLISSFG